MLGDFGGGRLIGWEECHADGQRLFGVGGF